MASERERLSTIKIVVFYIIVSVTFLFGQAFPTLMIICGTLKNPWHYLKRVGHGVPGVMVIGLGGWGEIIHGLRRQPEAPSTC